MSLSVAVSPEAEDNLRALARLYDLPVSDLIAELLEGWVEHSRQDPKVAGRMRELVEEVRQERAARQTAPGVAKTFYLGRDLIDRYEAAHRARLKLVGPTARGHLFEAILEAGLVRIAEIPAAIGQLPGPARSEGWTDREPRTFYVSREVVQRLADEHRRWSDTDPVKKATLLEAVVASGLLELERALDDQAAVYRPPGRKGTRTRPRPRRRSEVVLLKPPDQEAEQVENASQTQDPTPNQQPA